MERNRTDTPDESLKESIYALPKTVEEETQAIRQASTACRQEPKPSQSQGIARINIGLGAATIAHLPIGLESPSGFYQRQTGGCFCLSCANRGNRQVKLAFLKRRSGLAQDALSRLEA